MQPSSNPSSRKIIRGVQHVRTPRIVNANIVSNVGVNRMIDQAAGLRALMEPALPHPISLVAAHPAVQSAAYSVELTYWLMATDCAEQLQLPHPPNILLLDATRQELADYLQLRVRFELLHLLEGQKRFDEVVQTLMNRHAPRSQDLRMLPAMRGLQALADEPQELEKLLQGFSQLQHAPDLLVVHAGPEQIGLASAMAALQGDMVWHVSPRPEVLTATYAQWKLVQQMYPNIRHWVFVHDVVDPEVALQVYQNLADTAQRFLQMQLGSLGYVLQAHELHQTATLQRIELVKKLLAGSQFDHAYATD